MNPVHVGALVAAAFSLGMCFGMWARDGYWRSKAASGIRAISGGRFYFVVEDGDRAQLDHVSFCISNIGRKL
jgi:hypothetical protein